MCSAVSSCLVKALSQQTTDKELIVSMSFSYRLSHGNITQNSSTLRRILKRESQTSDDDTKIVGRRDPFSLGSRVNKLFILPYEYSSFDLSTGNVWPRHSRPRLLSWIFPPLFDLKNQWAPDHTSIPREPALCLSPKLNREMSILKAQWRQHLWI